MPHLRARRPATAVLAVLVVALALVLGDASPAAAADCPPPAAGRLRVAVVVDHGDGRPVDAVCVVLDDDRPTGLDALAAYAAARGGLRFHPSGLLCGIGGNPATGCGEQVDGAYRYWSYWTGDAGTWSYASFGPTRRVADGAVEGWRLQRGAGNASDPPPGLAATTVGFPAAPPLPSTSPPPPAPPSTPAPAPGGSPTSPTTAAPDPAAGPGSSSPSPSSPGAGGQDGLSDGDGADAAGEDPDRGDERSTPATDAADPGPTAADGAEAGPGAFEVIDAEQASADGPGDGAGGSGPPPGVLAGLALIAALGAGAAWRWRQGAA